MYFTHTQNLASFLDSPSNLKVERAKNIRPQPHSGHFTSGNPAALLAKFKASQIAIILISGENLLLTNEYNIKLADFGLAFDLAISSCSVSNPSTAPTSLAGTHLFHAPEIMQKMDQTESYGRKSDIWSVFL